MKKLMLPIIASVLMLQCKKTANNDECCLGPIRSNFVLGYATLDSLVINVVYDNGAVDSVKTNINNIKLEINYKAKEVFRYNDTNMLYKSKFNMYARLYKDTSFNKPVDLCFKGTPCLIDTISAIDISCNRLYDDNHTSDMSLSDIVKISYFCAADYINNHYFAQHDSLVNVKTSTLQEFNKNNNYLIGIGSSSFLSFLSPPKESGEYIFTLKIYIKNKGLFTYKIKPILIEGIK